MSLLLSRLQKTFFMLQDVYIYLTNYRKLKKLSCASLLFRETHSHKPMRDCLLCGSKDSLTRLIEFPIGWPMPQNDHLLYFDYSGQYFNEALYNENLLSRGGGFFMSIPWNFCHICRNASLGIKFSREHLGEYYQKYYKRLAPSNEKRKNTKIRHAQCINCIIPKKSSILEIGSAEGYASGFLSQQGHEVYAAELSEFRNELSAKGVIPVDSIESFANDYFDCIYMHHVLEHIPDLTNFLSCLNRKLKPGGILFIQVPDLSLQIKLYLQSLKACHFSLINCVWYDYKLIKSICSVIKETFYWMDALGNNHIWAFTSFGLEYLLRNANFKVKAIRLTTKDRLFFDRNILAWPVDRENGQTPNGLTIVAEK